MPLGLITCPDCNHSCSTEAPSCPSCGRPLRQAVVVVDGRSDFTCPYCNTHHPPAVLSQISSQGWLFFFVFLLLCLPLSFIGFTMKEEYRVCSVCGVRLQPLRGQLETTPAFQGLSFQKKDFYIPASILGGGLLIAGLAYVFNPPKQPNPSHQYSTPSYTTSPPPSPSPTVTKRRAGSSPPRPQPTIIEHAPSPDIPPEPKKGNANKYPEAKIISEAPKETP